MVPHTSHVFPTSVSPHCTYPIKLFMVKHFIGTQHVSWHCSFVAHGTVAWLLTGSVFPWHAYIEHVLREGV
jgi:hypothetical protein